MNNSLSIILSAIVGFLTGATLCLLFTKRIEHPKTPTNREFIIFKIGYLEREAKKQIPIEYSWPHDSAKFIKKQNKK